MPVCEMCGEGGPLFRALIEGATLSVCQTCAKMGKVLAAPQPSLRAKTKPRIAAPEIVERLVDDFSSRIQQARQKLGLTQKEFAAKLAERETAVSKMEAGEYEPPIDIARRFEHILRVRLIEKDEEAGAMLKGEKTGPLTIGDIIKVKK